MPRVNPIRAADQGSANDTIIMPLDATVLGSLPAIDNSLTIDGHSAARRYVLRNLDYSLVQDDGLNMQWQSNCQNSMPTRNPLLYSNTFNGGPTPTNALYRKSPAIDAILLPDYIDQDGDADSRSDQRGFTRPRLTACDVGAFELQRKRSRTR